VECREVRYDDDAIPDRNFERTTEETSEPETAFCQRTERLIASLGLSSAMRTVVIPSYNGVHLQGFAENGILRKK
jgi:hypothetical protein